MVRSRCSLMQHGATDWSDFKKRFLPQGEVLKNILVSVATIMGGLAIIMLAEGIITYANDALAMTPSKLLVMTGVLAGCIWLMLSCIMVMHHAIQSHDHGGVSLVALPWRQGWPFLYIILTVPCVVIYLGSALRLMIARP